MVGVRERVAGRERDVSAGHDLRDARSHLCLVPVALVVDAAEGEPQRRRAEHCAGATILLSAGTCRLALGCEPASPIPTAGRRDRGRVAAEDGEGLDARSRATPGGDRRAEREHGVVEMRGHDDDAPASCAAGKELGHGAYDRVLDSAEAGEPRMTWRRFVPAAVRRPLRPLRRAYVDRRRRRPPDLGDLRRVTPIDPNWGFERGTPIDRFYVERFLGSHASDIRGRILEIGAPDYARRFGTGAERIDVLHARAGNPEATMVGDLTDAPHIPDEAFDCAIVVQTLQYVYDVRAALATLSRVLASGGVLLATVPGITRISAVDDELWGEWWHYTARSARRLAEEAFAEGSVEVETFGNVLAASGFLYGLASRDLRSEQLEAHDPLYQVIVGIRAVKRAS